MFRKFAKIFKHGFRNIYIYIRWRSSKQPNQGLTSKTGKLKKKNKFPFPDRNDITSRSRHQKPQTRWKSLIDLLVNFSRVEKITITSQLSWALCSRNVVTVICVSRKAEDMKGEIRLLAKQMMELSLITSCGAIIGWLLAVVLWWLLVRFTSPPLKQEWKIWLESLFTEMVTFLSLLDYS